MSGWVSAIGTCFACRSVFAFNPERVPSYEGSPLCEPCITRVNERRRAAGLPLWPVLPGAYEPEQA